MRRKLYKSRRGQISTEIMYAVGVIIMIFLLLTGISFNRRSELQKMDDYLQKRNECLKVANTIASLTSSGFNTAAVITLYNKLWIYGNGRITVGPSTTGTKETPCTYVGYVNPDTLNTDGYKELTGESKPYCFFNRNGKVHIISESDTAIICLDPPSCTSTITISCINLCTWPDPNLLFSACGL